MTKLPHEKPDPHRVAVLRSLPLEIKEQITGEEAEAFMFNRELPDSLLEKLKPYLADDGLDRPSEVLPNTVTHKENYMAEKTCTPCPTCQGKKIIDGICEVSSEWRGPQDDLADDTQCTPDQTCPTCKGKGYEE